MEQRRTPQNTSSGKRRRPVSGTRPTAPPPRRTPGSGRPVEGMHPDAPRRRRPSEAGVSAERTNARPPQHRRPQSADACGERTSARPPQHRRPQNPNAYGERTSARPPQHRRPQNPNAYGERTSARPPQHRRPQNPNAYYERTSARPPQHRRPQNSNTYYERTNTRPPQHRRPQNSSTYYERTNTSPQRRSTRPVSRGHAAQRVSTSSVNMVFLLGIVFLLIIIIVLGNIIISKKISYSKMYLNAYEASRPQYKIEEYIAELDNTFLDKMLRQAAEAFDVSGYETTEGIMDTMQADIAVGTDAKFSYKKKEDYTDSRPTYYITLDDLAIASVVLDRSGWTDDDFKFPVWRVNEPESVLDIQAAPVYTLAVTIPQGASLKVNGNTVSDELFTEVESGLELNDMEQLYMAQPMAQYCEIEGLFMPPTVTATDQDGTMLLPEAVPDTSNATQEYVFYPASSLEDDPELESYIANMTTAYIDYVTNKYKNGSMNYNVLSNYLAANSEASVLLYRIINDIFWNNDYNSREDNTEVLNIRKYSDKLLTTDVHMDTTLVKDGVSTNQYVATIHWVMVNNGYGWKATSFTLSE